MSTCVTKFLYYTCKLRKISIKENYEQETTYNYLSLIAKYINKKFLSEKFCAKAVFV